MSKTMLCVVLWATMMSGAASAAPLVGSTDDESKVRVNYADLDLGSARGVAVLRNRVVSAAESLCGKPQGLIPLSELWAQRRCVGGAVSGAFAQIDRVVASRGDSARSATASLASGNR